MSPMYLIVCVFVAWIDCLAAINRDFITIA